MNVIWILTILYNGFFSVVVQDGVHKYDEASDPNNRLNGEAAPIRPEGGAPFPIGLFVDFHESAHCYKDPQNRDDFGQQIHCRIAWSLLIANAEAGNGASQACWNDCREAIELVWGIKVQEYHEGQIAYYVEQVLEYPHLEVASLPWVLIHEFLIEQAPHILRNFRAMIPSKDEKRVLKFQTR